MNEPICFLDVETTGGSPYRSRIIEIGIIKVQNGRVAKKYERLINPETAVDPFVSRMTGIRQKDLENSPTFMDLADELLYLLEDSVIAAHNVRFDYGMLRHEFRRSGIKFQSRHFCTVRLARQLYPGRQNYNLDALIESFNLTCLHRHRAYDDAKAIWDFYKLAETQNPAEVFHEALKTIMKRPTIPSHIPADILDDLPEAPGVYTFYAENNVPLYIGKSKNVRERVFSHFVNDHQSATDLKISQQAVDVEVLETAGELGALLLESDMVKKRQPLLNRQLRDIKLMALLTKTATKNGYYSVEITQASRIPVELAGRIMGVFRTKKQAEDFLYELAKEHHLCPKLLGLEKGRGACFYSQIEECFGACTGQEPFLKYNLRFDDAFYKRKIKAWRFDGPIVIREAGEREELFVVDKWCLLGRYDPGTEGFDLSSAEYRFDYDVYKILYRYLNRPGKKLLHRISMPSPKLKKRY